MNNWKTTLIGAALAALSFLSIYQTNGGDLSHWQQWAIPSLIAALGVVSKDFNVSGRAPLLLACLLICSCTSLQQDAAKQELKVIGIQIAEAASKAAAEVALQTAERKLVELEKSPVPENPLAAMARTVAISKAWDLVAEARTKVADFHFSSRK